MEGFINSVDDTRTVLKGWLRPMTGNTSPISLRVGDSYVGRIELGPPGDRLRELKGDAVSEFSLTVDSPLPVGALSDGAIGVRYQARHDGAEVCSSESLRSRELASLTDWARNLPASKKERLRLGLGDTPRPINVRPESGNVRPSYIEFPVGLAAADNSVQLGREGYLFPVGGSNAIVDRFRTKVGTTGFLAQAHEAEKWTNLIRSRIAEADAIGASFRQVILPDKITAMSHYSPVEVAVPTPVYSILHDTFGGKEVYVDTLSVFQEWSESESPWLKADAHFSAKGALRVVRELLKSLSLPLPKFLDQSLAVEVSREGDLGARFFGVPVFDLRLEPDATLVDMGGGPVVTILRGPIDGRNRVSRWMGAHQLSLNECAPIDAKVMVFGTSSSNLGVLPNELSWWLSRIFREYHIVWLPEIEFDLAEKHKVDIVVGQTVERFLSRVPMDRSSS